MSHNQSTNNKPNTINIDSRDKINEKAIKNSKTYLLFRVLIHKLSPDLIVLLSVGQLAVFVRPLSRVFLAAIW